MSTLFFCTSGTSVISNLKKEGRLSTINKNTITDALNKADESTLMKLSAELNSLLKMGASENDKVIFLCSDTDEGEMVADCLSGILESDCSVIRIKGLQTEDSKKFETEGIPNLTEAIISDLDNYRYSYNVILNATAGYKVTVPYLTFIGMIFNLPIRYLFEGSNSIIELPPIPIEFDIERLKLLEPVIDTILSDYMSVETFKKKTGFSYDDMGNAAKDLILEEDGFVTLRPTGRILYQKYLQVKGNKIFIYSEVKKKLDSGNYDTNEFTQLFRKMRDPVHLQSKLHNEIKKKNKIDLDCYKSGSTSERIFFYKEDKSVYICDIFMHDEYERVLEKGILLKEKYDNKGFSQW